MISRLVIILVSFAFAGNVLAGGTGDLGIVIERASGSVQVLNTTSNSSLGRVEGLGDLSHASAVYSRDQRYAYVFGRDGGLSKIDIIEHKLVKSFARERDLPVFPASQLPADAEITNISAIGPDTAINRVDFMPGHRLDIRYINRIPHLSQELVS